MTRYERRLNKENEFIYRMIKLYCNKKHDMHNGLCKECSDLFIYANQRLRLCPHLPDKPHCSRCHLRCYDAEHKERIKKVMCSSARCMLLHSPVMALEAVFSNHRKRKP